ncbi:MAG TPA: competence/damage-inducible protein A [Acidothermaceae bacterium]
MKAEIVAIGTELLLGDIVNGNAAWLGRELADIGIDVDLTTAVGDNIGRISAAVGRACERADVVVLTGGLGPTQDDLTREALAELAGVRLVRDAQLAAALRARYVASGRIDFPENNLRMTDRPEGASALPNPAGTAPGLRLTIGSRGTTVYALPGVPQEMREIFSTWMRPELVERAGPGTIVLSRRLHTVGVWESQVSQALAEIDAALAAAANPTIAYLASQGQTLVRMTAKAATETAARELIAGVETRVRAALGDVIYGVDDDTLESVVHQLLLTAGATVATAESLTGGLLGAALSSTPGASETYRGGAVLYATDSKAAVVDVPATLLAERGPVDPDVAVAMADGARRAFDATYGLGTTGVAGPTEQDGKPVGTVYIALVGPADGPMVRELRLAGGRDRVRQGSVLTALDVVRRHLSGLPQR